MKKLMLLLAATGTMAAGAGAQSQRLNRTNTRTTTVTDTSVVKPYNPQVQSQPVTPVSSEQQSIQEKGSGTMGIDGSINSMENSGRNRSSSPQPDYQINNAPATVAPARSGTDRRTR